MTQGRKKAIATEVVDVHTNDAALAQAGAALTKMQQRSLKVSEALDEGRAYQRDRVVEQARFFLATGAEAMLNAGRCLVLLKENELHGDFEHIVENQLSMSASVARRMMQAAFKYLGPSLDGAAKRSALSVLGKSKMYELMVLDDEQLDELAAGGTVADLHLDELQTLSQRELRERVKDLQQTLTGKDKLLTKRDDKIRRLEERIERPYIPSDDSEAATAEEAALLEGVAAAVLEAQAGLLKLAAITRDMTAADLPDSVRARAHADIQYLAQRLAEVMSEAGIELDLQELVEPSWVKSAKKKRA